MEGVCMYVCVFVCFCEKAVGNTVGKSGKLWARHTTACLSSFVRRPPFLFAYTLTPDNIAILAQPFLAIIMFVTGSKQA
jgi:hypothetical protein